MFDDPNEDEKFKQMLGSIIGNGPAPYDVTTSMEQPDQSQLSAPYMPQSAAPMGIGGYTPPPAAAPPQYLDHVQGHQFGAADLAMLGGILAAALGGGKFRGAAMGSLAGQYGGAVMEANQRADQRNAQIDQYNSQLAAKDDPLERWKADQLAKSQAGNMALRQKELDAQTARDQRIADHQALEDARDPIQLAHDTAAARAGVDVDTAKKRAEIELDMRTKLAKILGKGEFAAPGGASGMNDPMKELKAKQAEALKAGIADGTIDPTTLKPVVKLDDEGNPIKPKTPAQKAADDKNDLLATPFPGMQVDDDQAWRAANLSPAERSKNLKYYKGIQQTLHSLNRMIDLREKNGTEVLGSGKSDYDANLTAAIGGFTQIGESGVLNGGEFARYKDFIPGTGPHANDAVRLFGGDDQTLEQLKGVRSAVKALAADGLGSIGASFVDDEATAPAKRPKGQPSGKIEFSDENGSFGGAPTGKPPTSTAAPTDSGETPGGKKLTTVVSPDGKTTKSAEMDDEQRARFQAAGWTVR